MVINMKMAEDIMPTGRVNISYLMTKRSKIGWTYIITFSG